MLNLEIKTRDQIVQALMSLEVRTNVGATLNQIAQILGNLKEPEVKEEVKEEKNG